MSVFVNLSNHPSDSWSAFQLEKASEYGTVVDIPFPGIDPYLTDAQMDALVERYLSAILQYEDPIVMLQGEFVFTYRLVCRLKQAGIKTLAGCSVRRAVEKTDENGVTTRSSEFVFTAFREY